MIVYLLFLLDHEYSKPVDVFNSKELAMDSVKDDVYEWSKDFSDDGSILYGWGEQNHYEIFEFELKGTLG